MNNKQKNKDEQSIEIELVFHSFSSTTIFLGQQTLSVMNWGATTTIGDVEMVMAYNFLALETNWISPLVLLCANCALYTMYT